MTEAQIDYILEMYRHTKLHLVHTGLSYELLNILVFVIGQPALIYCFIYCGDLREEGEEYGDSNIYLGIYLCYNTASWIYC